MNNRDSAKDAGRKGFEECCKGRVTNRLRRELGKKLSGVAVRVGRRAGKGLDEEVG